MSLAIAKPTTPRFTPLKRSPQFRPVAYYRAFAKISGGALAGLFLSQLYYWHNVMVEKAAKENGNWDGWMYKTAKEWEAELGFTQSELRTARKNCADRGLIVFVRAGVCGTCHYRLNTEAFWRLLSQIGVNETSFQIKRKSAPTKPQSGIDENAKPYKDTKTSPATLPPQQAHGDECEEDSLPDVEAKPTESDGKKWQEEEWEGDILLVRELIDRGVESEQARRWARDKAPEARRVLDYVRDKPNYGPGFIVDCIKHPEKLRTDESKRATEPPPRPPVDAAQRAADKARVEARVRRCLELMNPMKREDYEKGMVGMDLKQMVDYLSFSAFGEWAEAGKVH